MKIIVDAFGGDNAPLEIIKASRMACDELGYEIIKEKKYKTNKHVFLKLIGE